MMSPLHTTPSVDDLLRQALEEDIGKEDITSQSLIPPQTTCTMHCVVREPTIIAGLPIAAKAFSFFGKVSCTLLSDEGLHVPAQSPLLKVTGNARHILKTERVALNILQHLCGIATLTHQYIEAVKGTGITILDTRKTTPGLREIEKYAVRVGGATNHRMRLEDAILIKDNHIHVAGGLDAVLAKLKASPPSLPVEIECDTIEQVKKCLEAKVDRILLDNMPVPTIKEAVTLRNSLSPCTMLEASGGITLDNIGEIAQTTIDFLSIGALTHSAHRIDIALDAG